MERIIAAACACLIIPALASMIFASIHAIR